jgi:hypothetical protein
MSALASFVSGRRTKWVVIAQARIHGTRQGVLRALAATGAVITFVVRTIVVPGEEPVAEPV